MVVMMMMMMMAVTLVVSGKGDACIPDDGGWCECEGDNACDS